LIHTVTDTREAFGVVLGAVLLERIIDVFVLGALAVGLSLGLGSAGAPTWLGFGACGAAIVAFGRETLRRLRVARREQSLRPPP
jgi:hypothetical protein